jgi:pimeloyl-ACP methyl ester carboxylesterase
VPSEAVTISSGSRRLSGNVFLPTPAPDSAPGVLFAHGYKSSQASYRPRAEALVDALGFVCLTFDFSGHGASEGNVEDLGLDEHLADLVAAFDELARRDEVDGSRIGVAGASYGAYLAARLVTLRPVKRLLLRAPAFHAEPGPGGDVLAGLQEFAGEILVVESEHDDVIPPSVIERYVASSPRAHRAKLAGAAHGLAPEFEQPYGEIVREWFREL